MDSTPSTSKGCSEPKRRKKEVYRYEDPNFEAKVMKLLKEVEEEEEFEQPNIPESDSDSDFEPEVLRCSSESDSASEDYEVPIPKNLQSKNCVQADMIEPLDKQVPEEQEENETDFYFGKNGFKWTITEPSANRRTPKHNIIRFVPGMKNIVKNMGPIPQPEQIWSKLIDETILQEVITWTNLKLQDMRTKVDVHQKSNYRDTELNEMKGLIGLFLLTGIYRSNFENMLSLFSTKPTGRPIFRAVMSVKRFEILLTAIRFDNSTTREERKKTDPTAAISTIFQSFLHNCQNLYCVGESVCVDEMLIPFRGRCKFKVYMPAKPNKYGIKVLCLTDARTSYFYNAYIYCGKGTDGLGLTDEERKCSIPTQSVIRLVRGIEGSSRNITADNWFASIELMKQLWQRQLTFVGTIRKNKKEIPPNFLPNRKRQVGSSLYAFTDKFTLVSYVPKPNKAVLLVSSLHHQKGHDQEINKPEIVAYYNKTKGGVDSMDQKCANYSSNRRCRRWPLSIFYTIINISAANSYILYLCFKDSPEISRFRFIENLALALIRPHLIQRLTIPNLRSDLRVIIEKTLQHNEEEIPQEANPQMIRSDKLEKKRKCSNCPYIKNRNTAYKCVKCDKPICLECSKKLCNKCCNEL